MQKTPKEVADGEPETVLESRVCRVKSLLGFSLVTPSPALLLDSTVGVYLPLAVEHPSAGMSLQRARRHL